MNPRVETNPNYRPDIDGLRAVAVLIVVFYHAHMKGFSGGFIGVDVFFVISGFLISTLVVQEFMGAGFSLTHFFARRARRILPALSATILFTGAAGFFLLPPDEFSALAKATKGLAFLVSNYIFLKSQNDYWAQNTLAFQPLLHTWSVAIEEQFYILFPIFLSLFFVIKSKTQQSLKGLGFVFLVLLIFSFASSAILITRYPPEAFYLLQARGWELLLGCVLSIWVMLKPHSINRKILETLSWVGLALILLPELIYSHQTSFPSWHAIPPCLGAASIILAGSNGNKASVNQILSHKYLVLVGLMSYSIYLWHWPVFVFAQSPYWLYWNIPLAPVYVQLLIAFAIAYMSWRFIETPTRSKKNSKTSSTLFMGVASLAFILSLGLFEDSIVRGTAPISQHTPAALQALISTGDSVPFRAWQFSKDPKEILTHGGRPLGDKSVPPSFIVLGDSFASQWGQALDQAALARGKSGLMMAREWCAGLSGLSRKSDEQCFEINEARFEFIEHSKVKNIVLASDWPEIKTSETGPAYFSKSNPAEKDLLLVSLERTLARLKASGKSIYFVLPMIASLGNPLSDAILSSKMKDKVLYRSTYEEYLKEPGTIKTLQVLTLLQQRYNITIIDPTKLICAGPGCKVAENGKPFYHDAYHLSFFGSESLVKVFDPLFDNL